MSEGRSEASDESQTVQKQSPFAPSDESDIADVADFLDIRHLRMEAFMGPMPHPRDLAKYEEVLPGFADRQLAIQEKRWELAALQAKHRQELENRSVESEIYQAKWGLRFGFAVAVLGFVTAAIFAFKDQPLAGVAISALDIGGLVGVFVYGSQSRKNERLEKMRILSGQEDASE